MREREKNLNQDDAQNKLLWKPKCGMQQTWDLHKLQPW